MRVMKQRRHKPQRVHLHAYERLRSICAEIQKDRCPKLADLARLIERDQRTVQRNLEVLRNDFQAPLVYDHARRGFRFSDTSWRLPPIKLTEGELISFFAAERLLRASGCNL